MQPPVVVVHSPLVENDPSIRQAQEQFTIEQLVPKPAVEGFHVAILSRVRLLDGERANARLTGLHDGQPKVFRDSAVENLREFFERFWRLNIWSSPELDALVEQAQQTTSGVEPQTLRDSNRLRQMVAWDFEQIQGAVGDLLVDRPRRNILRRGQAGAGA
jgi:hypothetical protein